jgi:hypothetical protein
MLVGVWQPQAQKAAFKILIGVIARHFILCGIFNTLCRTINIQI